MLHLLRHQARSHAHSCLGRSLKLKRKREQPAAASRKRRIVTDESDHESVSSCHESAQELAAGPQTAAQATSPAPR
eukprot:2874523-Pleurochrysis_carterae.AAC.1